MKSPSIVKNIGVVGFQYFPQPAAMGNIKDLDISQYLYIIAFADYVKTKNLNSPAIISIALQVLCHCLHLNSLKSHSCFYYEPTYIVSFRLCITLVQAFVGKPNTESQLIKVIVLYLISKKTVIYKRQASHTHIGAIILRTNTTKKRDIEEVMFYGREFF